MEFFRSKLAILEKESAELSEEMQAEISLFRRFFEIFSVKQKALESVLDFIENKKSKQFMRSIGILKNIPELNKEESSVIRQVLGLDQKAESIMRVMLAIEKKEFEEIERETKSLSKYFSHLNDKLRFLLKLLESQTEYFKGRMESKLSLRVIEQSLIKDYVHFYQLLSIERNTVKEIASIFHQVRSELRILLKISNEEDKKNKENIVIGDLINPNSIAFREFYNGAYKATYKNPNLRDTMEHMRGYLNRRFQAWHMAQKKLSGRNYLGQGRNHLLLARIGTEIVGGVLSEFIGLPQSRLSFGVVWFFCISPKFSIGKELEIFSRLHKATIETLMRDSSIFGYNKFSGLFIEIRDAEKMKEQGIAAKTSERITRILSERYGYRKLGFNYLQLPPGSNQKTVRDLSLMVLPFDRNWMAVKGIPQSQCLKIIDIYVYCLVEEYEHSEHESYMQMIQDIKSKKIVPFIP